MQCRNKTEKSWILPVLMSVQSVLMQPLFFLIFIIAIATAIPQKGYAEAPQLPACYTVPDCRIEGVSLLSGNYCNEVDDLATAGVDPIILRRYQSSEHPYNGWQYDIGKHLLLKKADNNTYAVHYPDGNGGIILFSSTTPVVVKKHAYVWPACIKLSYQVHGESSLPRYPNSLSGQDCLDNVRIEVTDNGSVVTAYHGDGTIRRFIPLPPEKESNPILDGITYELERENLPSGNQRWFWFLKEAGKQIGRARLETRSSKGTFINHIVLDKMHQKDSIAITHEDVKVDYRRSGVTLFQRSLVGNHFFSEIVGPNKIPLRYAYDQKMRLAVKGLPEDRVVSVTYEGEGSRVSELKTPTPNDLTKGQYGLSHRFVYPQRQDKLSEVQVCPAERTPFRFLSNNGKLLQYTRHYIPQNKFAAEVTYSVQKFFWGNRDKCEDLLAIALFPDAQTNTAIGCRSFTYDTCHNITEETLYGNLSGTCVQRPAVDDKGKVHALGSESAWTRYRYSTDGRNLPWYTEDSSGKVTLYAYKEGTNLLVAEIVGKNSNKQMHPIHRTFHTYNDQGARIETVIDDGIGKECGDLTGVTMRRVTRMQVKQEGIAIGVPLMEEEFYLNAKGELELLQRRKNDYDAKGRLVARQVFGSDGKKAQKFSWHYDNEDRLVKSIGPSGTVTIGYDANGNRVEEHFIERGLAHYNTYDRLNNLIERKEVDKHHGGERIWRYRYNIHGQCTEEIDPLDNVTLHHFDSLGREIETIYPWSMGPDGKAITPSVCHAYDICDLRIESRTSEKHGEKMAYNMRGQITEHTFPDGAKETKEYTLGGALKKTRSRLGLLTEYDTDFMGRATAKRDYDAQGQLLSAIYYEYQGLLLKSMTHENGPIIEYHYDGAGRLIEQERNHERELSYTYDTMGRLHTKTEWIDANSAKVTTYAYDVMDHVISEKVSDLQGALLSERGWSYDLQGNCTEERQRLSDGTTAVTKTRYDGWNRIVETVDPEGHKTHFTYEIIANAHTHVRGQRNQRNGQRSGQNALKVTQCDAKGRLHITIHYPSGRVAEEQDIDSLGVLLRSHKLFYDALGHVTMRQDAVYMNGTHIKDITTKWVYNEAGHVAKLIEAVGTPEEKQTHTLYTPDGQPKWVRMPSSEVHEFTYNIRGEKIHHRDERGTFAFAYTYDAMGNMTEVVDQVVGTSTKRVFDLRGRMTQEELGYGAQGEYGLVVAYEHDLLGRTKEIKLPDGSSVVYEHDPAYLRRVTRLDKEGNVRYVHRYTHIDLAGHTLQAELAGHCGSLETQYTKRGMIQAISMGTADGATGVATGAATWGQSIPQDGGYDALGNLLSCTTRDPAGEHTERYAYDGLNQLTQEESGEVGFAHSYTYDSLYNRQIQDGVQGQFNHLNQLLERGDCVYHYDKNGQTISIEQGERRTDCTYDGLGRLTSVQSGNQRTTYMYDPFHRRLAKSTWTLESGESDSNWHLVGTERFLYLDQNEVGSVDQEGQLLTFRPLGRGVGAEIGASIALEISDRIFVPLHDQSGSIAALLDAADGTIVEYARYSAFGQRSLFDAQCQPLQTSAVGNPWGYASKRVDSESGWNFFGRRYYNPQEGRWMTPDPLGFAEGPNLYAYVMNSPMTHADLYGLAATHPWERAGEPPHRNVAREGIRDGYIRPTFFSGVADSISRFFHAALPYLQVPGRMVEMLSRHLVPIPGIRDMGMMIGRILSFRPPQGCAQCRETNSYNFSIGEDKGDKWAYTISNGICTSDAEFKRQVEQLSKEIGGRRIYATYNATRGLALDILRSVYMMAGGLTDASYRLAESWQSIHDRMGADTLILHRAHSQGGQVTWGARNLVSDGILQNIEVKTFGSAHLIPKGTFKSAKNYISTRDAVPFIASPHRWIQARRGSRRESNVYFIKGSGAFGCDHLLSGTYSGEISRDNRDILARFPLSQFRTE